MKGRIVAFLIASNLILLAGLIIAVVGNPYTAKAQSERKWSAVASCMPGNECQRLLGLGYEPFAAHEVGHGQMVWMRK